MLEVSNGSDKQEVKYMLMDSSCISRFMSRYNNDDTDSLMMNRLDLNLNI